MAGFGVCAVCGKKGFTRKGSTMCTRCEKRSVPAEIAKPEPAAEVSAAPAPAPARRRRKRMRILGGRIVVGGGS